MTDSEVTFANIKEGNKSNSVGNRMTIAQYKGLRSQSIITQLKNNNFNGDNSSTTHDLNTLKV